MSMTYEEMIQFVKKNEMQNQLYISAKYLLKNKEFELNIDGLSSYTDGSTINIGYPYKLIEILNEEELIMYFMASMGHEIQHFLSSPANEIDETQKIITKDLSEKRINRYTAENIANSILNSLEDARIDNILINRKKGFLKYIKFMRYKLFMSYKLEKEELYDFINTIYIYATTGLYPRGFENIYRDTKLYEEFNKIKNDIESAVYARTCKDCMSIVIKIKNKIIDYLKELVQKDEGLEQEKFIENVISSGKEEKEFNYDNTNSSKIDDNSDLNNDEEKTNETENIDFDNAEFYEKQDDIEGESKELKDEEVKDLEKYYVEKGANPKSSIVIKRVNEDKSEKKVELTFDIKRKIKKFNYEIIDIMEERKRPLRRNQKRGLIDFNNLYRFDIFGDADIFIKKARTNKYDTVFYFLVDGSESMKEDNKWQYAVETMAVLEGALKEIVKIKVVVFNAIDKNTQHIVIKDFDDIKDENLIYTSYKKEYIYPKGANKDGANIRIASKELEKRNEKQKILFILSDGMPSAYSYNGKFAVNDVKTGVKEARSKNIKVISIMFGSKDFRKEYYRVYKEMYEKNIISTEPSKIFLKIIRVLKDIFANG